jgi:hypothetical protein
VEAIQNILQSSGGVLKLYNSCLACKKPWVQSLVLQKKKESRKKKPNVLQNKMEYKEKKILRRLGQNLPVGQYQKF